MNRVFISTNGSRLARAECSADELWSVDFLPNSEGIRCLAVDPCDRNIVYAGTNGNGVLRSEDRGKTWRPAGMEGRIVKSLAVSPIEPGVLYAGTKPPMLFVSRDRGQHWMELESFRRMRRWWWFTPAEWPPTQPYVQGLAVSPTDPNVIVAGIELGNVLRSADGGTSWTGHQKGALRDCHSLTFHPTNGNWVYEGGGSGSGAAFSRDAGITWAQPDPVSVFNMIRAMFFRSPKRPSNKMIGHYGFAAAGDPARPEVVYCATAPGPGKAHGGTGNSEAYIYRCEGSDCKRLSGGLPQPLNYMPYALITDREAPGHLYAGLSNGDIWHTPDYGDHWRQLPVNMGTVWTAMIMI